MFSRARARVHPGCVGTMHPRIRTSRRAAARVASSNTRSEGVGGHGGTREDTIDQIIGFFAALNFPYNYLYDI